MASNPNLDSPFDPEKLLTWLNDGTLRNMAMKGYIAYAQSDGKMGWKHYTEARTKFVGSPGDPRNSLKRQTFNTSVDIEKAKSELTPIVKRTPQQRVESLVKRLVEESRKAGTIPGHTDRQIREIVGEYWKTGQTQVTTHMVQKIAQKYMEEAEVDAKHRDAHRVTRYSEK